jgi:hypothetical protein
MLDGSLHTTFTAALNSLVDDIRKDRSILAVILCGSLSHDTVWARSDIDLVLVTIDDKKIGEGNVALYADGVNVHAILLPRLQFRQVVEGSAANSFVHAFLAKGRLLYTHDPSITDLCARLSDIGARDSALQMLSAATHALSALDKAHKWQVTRGDLDYTALWILYAATPLAQIEVIARGRIADREVIPQALALNPALFKVIYSDLLNTRKTAAAVAAALEAADACLAAHAAVLFVPLIDYLRDAGEARAASEIESHFTRQFNLAGVTIACEYLSSQGIIGKASLPAHLTRKSSAQVQELAFFYHSP